jgi:predicted deacylase
LVYEAGEAYRFDEQGIEVGVAGALRILRELGMLESGVKPAPKAPIVIWTTTWVRARRSGICLLSVQPGDHVEKGQRLGEIRDAIGGRPTTVRAPETGIAIGVTRDPVVNRGEALVNVGVLD